MIRRVWEWLVAEIVADGPMEPGERCLRCAKRIEDDEFRLSLLDVEVNDRG